MKFWISELDKVRANAKSQYLILVYTKNIYLFFLDKRSLNLSILVGITLTLGFKS